MKSPLVIACFLLCHEWPLYLPLPLPFHLHLHLHLHLSTRSL